jgi:hypothetical protein
VPKLVSFLNPPPVVRAVVASFALGVHCDTSGEQLACGLCLSHFLDPTFVCKSFHSAIALAWSTDQKVMDGTTFEPCTATKTMLNIYASVLYIILT